MVKFADLHKSVDDAFNKDFLHGKVNVEHKHKYDGGEMCSGTITYKLNHNPIVGSTSAVCEGKSTFGSNFFGMKFLDGMVITDKYSDNVMNMKFEKACASSGSKFTYDYNYDWAKQSVDKTNFNIDYNTSAATLGLKVTQSGDMACAKIPGSVNAHVTTAMAGHNLGCNVNYNVESGKVDHHLKFKVNHGQGYAVVGMKNANDTELLVAQKVGKSFTLGPFGEVNLKNCYAKASYSMKDGAYGVSTATEGDYTFGDFNSTFKQTYNPLNGEYKESMKFKVTDSMNATISHKTNAHDGWMKHIQFGAALNFSL